MAEKSKVIAKAAPQQIEASRPAEERETVFFRPNVDIVDLPDEFLVLADVPGAARDDINVMFEEDVLTIDAEVAPRHEEESSRFFRREYGVGRFHRRFVVEAPVDADGLTAEHDHGVLTIHLPKAEKTKGRKIPVSSA